MNVQARDKVFCLGANLQHGREEHVGGGDAALGVQHAALAQLQLVHGACHRLPPVLDVCGGGSRAALGLGCCATRDGGILGDKGQQLSQLLSEEGVTQRDAKQLLPPPPLPSWEEDRRGLRVVFCVVW